MTRLLVLSAALCMGIPLAAQRPPLYLVDGREWPADSVSMIVASDIATLDMLPADEETIARYGDKASGGAILITLKYDAPARFDADSLGFEDYIARRVAWGADEPAARVAVRYKITAEGATVVDRVLESTDNRLKRRVLKAMAEAPQWTPATKNGVPVETRRVLSLRLPEGKPMPQEPYIRIR